MIDDLALWQRLTTRFRADVFCGLFLDRVNDGIELRPKALADLSARGLLLGLDIYRLGDDQHDCSGFVRAVAAEAGVPIDGNANQIVDTLQKGGGWTSLGHDANRASQMSAQGNLVIAGRKEPGHGHVAIIVPGTSQGQPKVYRGSLSHGIAARNAALSYSWTRHDLTKVEYWYRPAMRLEKR